MNVKKLLRKIEFRAKKRLGQNFLRDEGTLDLILDHARVEPHDVVLEIGAGLGILTERLSSEANRVVSLEVDTDLYRYLTTRFKAGGNVLVLHQDILKYNGEHLPERGAKIIANVPYYISTPILMHLMGMRQHFSMILIMLQLEVAQRVIAQPGTKRYGSLSIAIQLHMDAEVLEHIPRTAFYPTPKVDSALVRLQALDRPRVDVPEPARFSGLVRAAFSQRRKTLRNSLLGSGKFSAAQLDAAFASTGISPTRRAETLSIQEFSELAQFLL